MKHLKPAKELPQGTYCGRHHMHQPKTKSHPVHSNMIDVHDHAQSASKRADCILGQSNFPMAVLRIKCH